MQVWFRPHRHQLGAGFQTSLGAPLGTTDISLDRNKDLKKPHLTGPSTGEKEWALIAIWRETQRQPHLDSKVWADGCHRFFSSTSCQDPPSSLCSTPPCKAHSLPTGECWQALSGCGLEAGNDASNAVAIKLKDVISRGQLVWGSWLRVRLCEGRDRTTACPHHSGPFRNSC